MNERPRPEACLDRRTLETIAAGRCPIDQVEKLRTHLPRCPRCRAAIVASTGQRPRGGDTVLLAPGTWGGEPEPPRLALRVGLMVLALLSIGVAIGFSTTGANVREVVERSLRPASAQAPRALPAPSRLEPAAPRPSISASPALPSVAPAALR